MSDNKFLSLNNLRAIIRIGALLFCINLSVKSYSAVVYQVRPDGKGLSSLEGAKKDIDDRLSKGLSDDCTVILDDGIYYLDEPIVFDRKTNGHSISFVAKEGASPAISGGKKITTWLMDENKKGVIKAQINEDVSNLWIGDERMKKSAGFVGYSTGIFEGNQNGKEIKGLLFPKEGIPPFEDISGLELRHYHCWRSFCFKVTAIYDSDSVQGVPEDQVLMVLKNFDVALSQVPKSDWIGIGPDRPYYFENSRELLDEPGEWCYTPSNHTIYYFMKDDESPDNIEAVIPNLQTLISIKSTSCNEIISNLFFQGVEFSNNDWKYPVENGFITHQGSEYYVGIVSVDIMPAAILVEDSRNVTFDACKFTKLSSNGLHIKNNIDGVRVENCIFTDLSGTAVCVSDYYHSSYSDLVLPVKNILIHNNIVNNIGVDYASCSAIEAFYAEDLTISHNELYNCPYTGISVGWGWTMEPTVQKNVRILNNKIIGDTQKCFDGGAIYSLSHFAGDGLLIQGNYIDETFYKPIANTQGAIYADQGSSKVHINNNVVLTDRNWFFYHQAGKVEVDTIYVLSENRNNYGGIDAISGGTEVVYSENGEHIFSLPHELAEEIIQNAGIQKKDSIIPDRLDNIREDETPSFVLKAAAEGLKIIPCRDFEDTIFVVRLYGVDGRLIKTSIFEKDTPFIIDGIAKGFHIIEISSNNSKDVFRVSI